MLSLVTQVRYLKKKPNIICPFAALLFQEVVCLCTILPYIGLKHRGLNSREQLFATMITLCFCVIIFQAVHFDLDTHTYAAALLNLFLFLHTLGGVTAPWRINKQGMCLLVELEHL